MRSKHGEYKKNADDLIFYCFNKAFKRFRRAT